jgi:hypothetical protein
MSHTSIVESWFLSYDARTVCRCSNTQIAPLGVNRILSHRCEATLRTAGWLEAGSCEVVDFGCECTIYLAIRPEPAGLWSIRCCGKDQVEVIGPDYLDSLAEELVEDRGVDRNDLLNLFAFSGLEAVEEFARQNQT